MELTKKERDVLLDIVKKTIAAKVQDREMPKFTVDLLFDLEHLTIYTQSDTRIIKH